MNCRKCNLWKTRKNPVVGEGERDADIMFIGEAPGYWEDVRGRPFVGKAGKIFDELLNFIKLDREDVYITNILKCRPPKNRDPLEDEIDACVPYLDKQIELLDPSVIVTLGKFSSHYILEKFRLKIDKISSIHGKEFKVSNLFSNLTIIPMYHPATAVYNPNMKDILKSDFLILKKFL